MKKHLHGKRHTIARRSVVVGRARKYQRRMARLNDRLLALPYDARDIVEGVQAAFWLLENKLRELSIATGVPARFLKMPPWVDRDVQRKD